MNHVPSYPSVFALGHKAIADLFTGPVVVQEKYDGSQFSFMLTPDGEVAMRSKGKDQLPGAVDKMFLPAAAVVEDLTNKGLIVPGYVYRCEYLAKPKHNTLVYSRIPFNYLVLFDIETGPQEFMPSFAVREIAKNLGLEPCAVLNAGTEIGMDWLREALETESSLGGTKVEGVVIKNYGLFTMEKKIAVGKYVSERFKEIHDGDWRKRNPTGKDVVQTLIDALKTDARWEKGVQHLRDAGQLEGSPRDIGNLIREVRADTLKEGQDFITKALWEHYWPQIERGVVAGLPEWYKQRLAENAFEGGEE